MREVKNLNGLSWYQKEAGAIYGGNTAICTVWRKYGNLYSRTCFERPLVLTIQNGRKSRVAAQTKVDQNGGLFLVTFSCLVRNAKET